MGRVKRMFGPREDWGRDNERERVEAGKAARRAANTPHIERIAKAPAGPRNDEKNLSGTDSGIVPAGEIKKAGFTRGSEPGGVKGFLSIRCIGCGRIVSTCLHEKRTIFNCKQCGHPNLLENLKTMKVECPRCSFRGLYKTNREDGPIVMECLNCSQPVRLRKGYRRGNYVTIKESSE